MAGTALNALPRREPLDTHTVRAWCVRGRAREGGYMHIPRVGVVRSAPSTATNRVCDLVGLGSRNGDGPSGLASARPWNFPEVSSNWVFWTALGAYPPNALSYAPSPPYVFPNIIQPLTCPSQGCFRDSHWEGNLGVPGPGFAVFNSQKGYDDAFSVFQDTANGQTTTSGLLPCTSDADCAVPGKGEPGDKCVNDPRVPGNICKYGPGISKRGQDGGMDDVGAFRTGARGTRW